MKKIKLKDDYYRLIPDEGCILVNEISQQEYSEVITKRPGIYSEKHG